MSRSPSYCQYPIACVAEWARPPVLLGQYTLCRDTSGQPVGYMTWAFLAVDTELRLLGDPGVLFHISEWNEGDRLWIMDLAILNRDVRGFISHARGLFRGAKEAFSLRRCDDGSVRKITRWTL